MAVTTTLEELHAKYGPRILSKRLELLNKTEVSLRDFSFIIETDDYDMLIINGIEPKLHGFTLYPQKTMATTHGSKCNWVLHPEAVKGYLECRKLLVERETKLVYLTINPPICLMDMANAGTDREKPLSPVECELETVRAEIAHIDETISGGK